MSKNYIFKFIGFIIAIVAIITLVVALYSLTSFNDTEYIVTVTDKERIESGENSRYLVFTESEQGETIVFENTDNLLSKHYGNVMYCLENNPKIYIAAVVERKKQRIEALEKQFRGLYCNE